MSNSKNLCEGSNHINNNNNNNKSNSLDLLISNKEHSKESVLSFDMKTDIDTHIDDQEQILNNNYTQSLASSLNDTATANNNPSNQCQCKSCKIERTLSKKKASRYIYYCHIHDKKFGNKLYFKEHMKRKHHFFCNYCGIEIFINKENVSLFIERLYSFKCGNCNNNIYFTKEQFNSIKGEVNVFKCKTCDKTFNSEILLNKHIRLAHLSPIDKRIVGKGELKEDNNTQLNSLISTANNLLIPNQTQTITQTVIKTETTKLNDQTKELNANTNQGKDNKDANFIANNNSNMKANVNLFQCKKCSKTFKKQMGYEHHVKAHDNECIECHKLFNTLSDYTNHYNEIHLVVCIECNKRFKSKEGLINHYNQEHKNTKQYKCNEHDVIFDSIDNIIQHIVETHVKPIKINKEKK